MLSSLLKIKPEVQWFFHNPIPILNNITPIMEKTKMEKFFTEKAERINGWAAMIGFVAATASYLTTGQIIPGVF